MKIQADVLYSYVNKLTLGGRIDKVVINFEEDCVESMVFEQTKKIFVKGCLNIKSFSSYDNPIGKIAVYPSKQLLVFLKQFDKEVIDIIKKEYELHIKSSDIEGHFQLIETDFVKEPKAEPQLSFPITFKIDSRQIKLAYDSCRALMNGDSNNLKITLEGTKGKLLLTSKHTHEIRRSIEIHEITSEFVSSYNSWLSHVVEFNSGPVLVNIDSNKPIYIHYDDEEIKMDYLIPHLEPVRNDKNFKQKGDGIAE